MPKSTFFNLTDEKRERIIEVAIDEFANHSYQKASISRIVEKAEIAKGSFYQYFEDKKDLYKHLLINVMAEKKIKYLTTFMQTLGQLDFFTALREMLIAGVKFAQDHPELATISNDFTMGIDNKLKEEILGEAIPKSNQMLEELLVRGIEKGEIDPGIDVEFTTHVITSLTITISNLFLKEVKVKDDMEIMIMLDKMNHILENGIKRR